MTHAAVQAACSYNQSDLLKRMAGEETTLLYTDKNQTPRPSGSAK